MSHVIYQIVGGAPAPQGGGDARSWFYFYKFHPGAEEEFYLPAPEGMQSAPGDILWISVDRRLVGAAPVLRVEVDPLSGKQEIWYRGDQIVTVFDLELPPDIEATSDISSLQKLWERYMQSKGRDPRA